MQTWKRMNISLLLLCFFCSQLHWDKDESYLLFKTTVVYCSIMLSRMYEVIKSCHVFSSLVATVPLVNYWIISNTPMRMLYTCVLACYNNKFATVLYLLPIPRITSVCSFCRDNVWSHIALYKQFFLSSVLVLVQGVKQLRKASWVLTLQLLELETFLRHK